MSDFDEDGFRSVDIRALPDDFLDDIFGGVSAGPNSCFGMMDCSF